MKKINALARYFETNEWAIHTPNHFIIGITDFAQTVFGNLEFVELPAVGQVFQQGATFAITESSKASNDISMPIGGKIIEVNQSIIQHPKWLNEDPYGKGWLVKIQASNPAEWNELMNAEQYRAFIGVFFNKT